MNNLIVNSNNDNNENNEPILTENNNSNESNNSNDTNNDIYDDMPELVNVDEDEDMVYIQANIQRIEEMIERNIYPDHLQYLSNTNYLIMYNNEIQEYIQSIIIPNLLQWDYDKTEFYHKMIDSLYYTDFESDDIFNNIGSYLMLNQNSPIDIEHDMNIIRKYIMFNDFKRNWILHRFNILINMISPIFNLENEHTEDVKLIVPIEKLNELPILNYNEIKTEFNSSCYCGEEFEPLTKVRKVKCNHVFHPECIDKWLCECNYKCPICRNPAGDYTTNINSTD